MTSSSTQKTILIVDDEERNLRLLRAMVEAEGYAVQTLNSGQPVLAHVLEHSPDLILLDVMMPGLNGYQVARMLKSHPQARVVPIVMVTALDDHASRLTGLEAGAADFLTKPIDRTELHMRLRNHLRLKEFNDFLTHHNKILDAQVRQRTEQLVASYQETIQVLTRAAAYKDEETGAHVTRIGLYTVALSRAMGMDPQFCDLILYASPMHDIGKIAIPDAILNKPGSFNPDEWEIMKTHAALGAELLAGSGSPYLAMGGEIAAGHHERWDGSGYPLGLAGNAIPVSARIMNICDQYDALRSQRPYKPALDHDRTMDIITRGDGRTQPQHFSPEVLATFTTCANQFRDIYDANDAQASALAAPAGVAQALEVEGPHHP